MTHRNKSETDLLKIASVFTGQVSKSAENGFVYLKESLDHDSDYMFEFAVTDILRADQIEQMTNLEGLSYPLIKLWVKKGVLGKKVYFFKVE